MIKARTCEGCKALESYQGCSDICILGFAEYKTTNLELGGSVTTTIPPSSGCPKPKTYFQLIKIKQEQR